MPFCPLFHGLKDSFGPQPNNNVRPDYQRRNTSLFLGEHRSALGTSQRVVEDSPPGDAIPQSSEGFAAYRKVSNATNHTSRSACAGPLYQTTLNIVMTSETSV